MDTNFLVAVKGVPFPTKTERLFSRGPCEPGTAASGSWYDRRRVKPTTTIRLSIKALPALLASLAFSACGSPSVEAVPDAAFAATDGPALASDVAASAADAGADSMADSAGAPVDLGAPDAAPGACTPEGEVHRTAAADGTVGSLEEFATLTFDSNPPSSGRHCAQGGAYGGYTEAQPLPRCNYLANLAQGGVVLTYNCPAGCADIAGQLARAIADVQDPDCTNNRRVLITPDKALDVKVAAVAWGFTWRSDCLDTATRPALVKFINDHIGTRGEAPGKDAKVCQ
jgi:hypothetical protein